MSEAYVKLYYTKVVQNGRQVLQYAQILWKYTLFNFLYVVAS